MRLAYKQIKNKPYEIVKEQLDFTLAEPTSPAIGDKYVNTGSGNSSETNQALSPNTIVEWNGTNWSIDPIQTGAFIYDQSATASLNTLTFNGTQLVPFQSDNNMDYEVICFQNTNQEQITVGAWLKYNETTTNTELTKGTILFSQDVNLAIGDEITEVPTGFVQIPCELAGLITPDVIRTSYLETVPASVDAFQTAATSDLGSNSATGRGHLTRSDFINEQFANNGDAAGGIEGYPAGIVLDADGVPAYLGDVLFANSTNVSYNETDARGEIVLWEGFIFVPSLWNNNAVGTIRIQDSYTATNQSDRTEIWVGIKNNSTAPSLDRSDLTKVAESQVGVNFQLPTTWKNRWSRFFVIHTDLGGASQVNLVVDVIGIDGSVIASNVALSNFIWNLQSADTLPLFPSTQRIVTRTYTSSTGVEEWKDAGGLALVPSTLNQPIIQVTADYLPISFDVTTLAGSTVIENTALGDGGPYQYSFDGGITWQAGNTFMPGDTSGSQEMDIWQILPMVKDGTASSAIKSPSVLVTDPANQAHSINIAGAVSDATSHVEENRGWQIYFSNKLGENLEQLNNPALTWNLVNATRDNNYIYINNAETLVEGSAEASLIPVLPLAVAGEEYTVNYDIYGLAHGNLYTESQAKVEIYELVSGTILASNTHIWAGNTTRNDVQQRLSFGGTGKTIGIRVIVENNPVLTTDGWNGRTDFATTTSDSILKTGGSGWNTGIRSSTMKRGDTGVLASWKVNDATVNTGMFGLNATGIADSYTDIDFAIYFLGTNVAVYENGANRGNKTTQVAGDTFAVRINNDLSVDYLKNGTIFFTSTIPAVADSYYYFDTAINTTNQGINTITFNGDTNLSIPDNSTGHYIRLDDVQLFNGAFSDGSHYFKRLTTNNYILARGLKTSELAQGYATLTTSTMDVSESDAIQVTGDIRRLGTLEDSDDKFALMYRLDGGGSWMPIIEEVGQFEVATEVYTSPFYVPSMDVSGADTIELQLRIWSEDADTNEGWYIYDLGVQETNP